MITPQLVVKGVAGAIDWYTRALGAHELLRNTAPDGTSIMHAELLLGDSRFFVVDELVSSLLFAFTIVFIAPQSPAAPVLATAQR